MLTAVQTTRTASVRFLWPFLARAKACGKDVSYVADLLGLTEADLQNPDTRVSQHLLAELLEEAIARSGNRDLGLLAASYVDSSHFGIGEFIARSRPTVREAVESNMRYLPLLVDGAHYSLSVEGEIARLRFRVARSIAVHEAAYEFAVAIGVLRARRTTGIPNLAPLEVCFMHSEPEDTERHRALFRCPIRFGADVTEVAYPATFLDQRMGAPEPVLDRLLSREADRMLEQLPRPTGVAEQVEAELMQHADLGTVRPERIARKLGLGRRTLHRRLQEEGTNYREVLDRVRTTIATQQLDRSDRTIKQVAIALGFSNARSFHRAFKRWTGTTAARHRHRARALGPAGAATKPQRK